MCVLLLLLTYSVSVAVASVGCDVAAAWCSQLCEDVGDRYECRCVAGYQLATDGHSCVAADGKSLLLLHNRFPPSVNFKNVYYKWCHLFSVNTSSTIAACTYADPGFLIQSEVTIR